MALPENTLHPFLWVEQQSFALRTHAGLPAIAAGDVPGLPLVIAAGNKDVDLSAWMRENRAELRQLLRKCGGILFRGFGIRSAGDFKALVTRWSDRPMEYFDQTSPRSLVDDAVYTSTDYPPDQRIKMHNELSYAHRWPLEIFFFCVRPAEAGGETPIADCRKVLSKLSKRTLEKFSAKGVMYVRNMIDGLGLSWQRVYQTDDPAKVNAHCTRNGISFAWKGEDHLKTVWTRPAVREHPVTGEATWFNHAYFYNILSTNPLLLDLVDDKDELPFNTYYGDGSEIEPEVIEEIGGAFDATRVTFKWEMGDLLLLDNMLTAHGRSSYTGQRKVLVSMCEPVF